MGKGDASSRQVPLLGGDWRAFSIVSGMPGLEPPLIQALETDGLRLNQFAATLLLIDLPAGFALDHLPQLEHVRTRVIIVTHNRCPEYLQDLWDLGAAGLVTGMRVERTIVDAVRCVAQGERFHPVPPAESVLTTAERRLLRYVARGWDDQHIAAHLGLDECGITTTLTDLCVKLKLGSRVQAALYYWGRPELPPGAGPRHA